MGRFGTAFAVGAITSIGGMGLYRAIASTGAGLITRIIAMASYGPKAYILNTIARGQKPTLRGVYSSYVISGISSGLQIFKRLKAIYRYGGKRALQNYLR